LDSSSLLDAASGDPSSGLGGSKPDVRWVFAFFSGWDQDKNGLISFPSVRAPVSAQARIFAHIFASILPILLVRSRWSHRVLCCAMRLSSEFLHRIIQVLKEKERLKKKLLRKQMLAAKRKKKREAEAAKKAEANRPPPQIPAE
jgi:hypothetical protein